MLTHRNIRITVLLGLAVLLFAGTAAGKNQRAAQRQATRQEQRDENQAQAAERRADNQAPRQQNRQAPAEQRADRQVERQPQAAQKQARGPARTEADKQAAVERRAEQQPVAAQKRAENQARLEANRQAAARRRAENQVQQQENRQVPIERREVKREQTPQKGQPTAQSRAENQVRRQVNRQIRVERREVKREQTPQSPAEKTAAKNENRRSITKNVNRDVNTQRVAEPRGKKVVKERDIEKTVTKNDRSFSKNIGQTVMRNTTRRLDRPRVVRPHQEAYSRYSLGDREGGSFHVRRYVSGRQPGRIFSHIVWPSYGYPVYYRHGPDLFVHYVQPAYHRKYVFVSVGGYWPVYCSSLRYSWYGWHPYTWYGCYPTAYAVDGDTYNYYTYNTYNYESQTPQSYSTGEYGGPLESVDETTFEDIRRKLAEQTQTEPEPETLTDKFFADGVTAFEQGDYATAAKAFADAIVLEPNDLVLPFAYVQALFASEQYSKAADILRLALEQMPADQQGLFFPRGLYGDDEIFFAQIEQLRSRTGSFSYDPDLSLLLGYQLIGAEKYDEARNCLERAGQYDLNQSAVTILVDLLNKLEEQPQNVSENI